MILKKNGLDYFLGDININKIYNIDNDLKDIYTKLLNSLINNKIDLSENKLKDILKSIEIYKNKKFNRCWVSDLIPHWFVSLKPIVEEKYNKNNKIKFLQIGIFEGLSLLYFKNVIFENFKIDMTLIDNYSTEPYFDPKKNFMFNTKDFKSNLIIKSSHEALIDLISNGETFDFIYYSGSRKPYDVFVDLALLSKVVAFDGCMLVDEYSRFSSYEGDISPNLVRNVFFDAFKRAYDIKDVGEQKLVIYHKKLDVDSGKIRVKDADCVNRQYVVHKKKS